MLFAYSISFSQDKENAEIISDFTGKISKSKIVLSWNLLNPGNIITCKISAKKSGNPDYENIKEIPFNGYFSVNSIDSSKIYSFTTKYNPEENGVYFFKLDLIDNKNSVTESAELKIGFSEIKEFKLHQNNPNPFNPTTSIIYEIFIPVKVNLRVYDLNGKEIETLVDDFQQPGIYKVDFDATKFGTITSGIYFYKLQTNYSSDIKKMIFAK